jgi:hypothetical protein
VACAVFVKARAAGMIDMTIIKNMRKAVDSHVMRELFAEQEDKQGRIIDHNNQNIPPAWSRNI